MSIQRIFFLGLFGLVFSANADAAKWVKLNGDREMTTYIDAESKRPAGDLIRLTYLNDFRRPYEAYRGYRIKSYAWDMEFDCRKRKMRNLQVAGFSGNMGKGNVRHNKDAHRDFNTKWNPVDSDADDSNLPLFKYACGAGKR